MMSLNGERHNHSSATVCLGRVFNIPAKFNDNPSPPWDFLLKNTNVSHMVALQRCQNTTIVIFFLIKTMIVFNKPHLNPWSSCVWCFCLCISCFVHYPLCFRLQIHHQSNISVLDLFQTQYFSETTQKHPVLHCMPIKHRVRKATRGMSWGPFSESNL